jgi:hypothetical protein
MAGIPARQLQHTVGYARIPGINMATPRAKPNPFAMQIDQLERRKREIISEMRALTDELHKVKLAISALTRFDDSSKDYGTYALLREFISTLAPGSVISKDRALVYMEENNWNCAAVDKLQAIRIALVNMRKAGEIVRASHGVYHTLS